MHYNCLVVDDEIDLAKATCEYFQMFDVSCEYVANTRDTLSFLYENEVDLILLDINLGDESGFNLCKKIREESDIPILFISARQSDDDVLIALNIGGDDYIKKPYTLSVLLAKVKVVLKRLQKNNDSDKGESLVSVSESKTQATNEDNNLRTNVNELKTEDLSNIYDKSDSDFLSDAKDRQNYKEEKKQNEIRKNESLYLDEGTMSVVVRGEKILLKAKEYKLLSCLYENKNIIVTKEKLFDNVWGDTFFSDATLNVHIRKLREKIEENPSNPQIIKTIWGTGYILVV